MNNAPTSSSSSPPSRCAGAGAASKCRYQIDGTFACGAPVPIASLGCAGTEGIGMTVVRHTSGPAVTGTSFTYHNPLSSPMDMNAFDRSIAM